MGSLSMCMLLLLFLAVSTPVFSESDRIIGGEVVEKNSIEYQVSLKTRGRHYCGGALLAPQWVLSVAHCKRKRHLMQVVLGEHDLYVKEDTEQIFSVAKIFTKHFNPSTFKNDIMLIKLNRPAVLNNEVGIVHLPFGFQPRYGTRCTVSGWGETKFNSNKLSPRLRSAQLQVVNCPNFYVARRWVTSGNLCAGFTRTPKDSCRGDSGGPLICYGRLVGIVSWGIGCGLKRFPGVYTNINSFIVWIMRTVVTNY